MTFRPWRRGVMLLVTLLVLVGACSPTPPMQGQANRPTQTVTSRSAQEKLHLNLSQLRQPWSWVNIEEIPLGDVIELVSDISEVKIAVNWVDLREANITRKSPVTVHLKDVPVETLLTSVLASVSPKLAFVIKDDAVVVSTREGLQRLAQAATQTSGLASSQPTSRDVNAVLRRQLAETMDIHVKEASL